MGALILGAFLMVHLCALLLPSIFEPLRSLATDRLFLMRSGWEAVAPRYDDTIVHVDLDDQSIRNLGTYYPDRTHYAQVIRNLAAAGVAAQLQDFIFAAPSTEEQDLGLIAATSEAGHVYYGMAMGLDSGDGPTPLDGPGDNALGVLRRAAWKVQVVGDSDDLLSATRPHTTFAALANAGEGLGFLDVLTDPDGVIRRAPLVSRFDDTFHPSIAFRVVCDYVGVAPKNVIVRPGRSVTLRDAVVPGSTAAHDIVIPIDRHGAMIVNYVGPWERMDHYGFDTVYSASDDRFALEDLHDELAGKIVVVSSTATGQADVAPVPTDPRFLLAGLHANVMHTILTEDFLRQLSPFAGLMLIEFPLLLIVFLLSTRLPSISFVVVTVSLGAAYYVAAAALFLFGNLIVDIPGPLMAVTASMVGVVAYRFHTESRARGVLRATFDAYFSPPVVKKIMAAPERVLAMGRAVELTVMLSDIKDFTAHSVGMDPDKVRLLLNEYFGAMIEIVFKHEGTLDKFMGDGLMVFFGDPEPQPDHALRCVRAAIEMQQRARELKAEWVRRGDMPLDIRIGINTGVAVVGNLGSARRLSYTAVGETVNLTQRLEANAPVAGILISRQTWELVNAEVGTRSVGPIRVKGFEEPIEVYEVLVDPAHTV